MKGTTILSAFDGVTITQNGGLVDQAYEVIRTAIFNRSIAPGARLSVPDIARQLGISRSPVREAILRIESEGLAESVARRGAVVARISFDELVEIYEVREVLEGLSARLATRRNTHFLINQLRSTWEAHSLAVSKEDQDLHMRMDAEFHSHIRSASENGRLVDALDRLQGQIRIAMTTTMVRRGGMHSALNEHREIIDAIEYGDPERSEAVMRGHIRRLREGLQDARREGESPNVREEWSGV